MRTRRGGDGAGEVIADATSRLPWPGEWSAPRPAIRMVLGAGLLTVFALGMVAGAIWALFDGQPGPGVLLAMGGVYLGHVAGLGLSMLRLRRGGTRGAVTLAAGGGGPGGGGPGGGGPVGATFRYAGWPCYWLIGVLGMTWAAVVFFVLVGLLAGALSSGSATELIMLVVAGAIGIYFGWLLLDVARGRIARGRVVMSPDGIFHRALSFAHFVPWSAVVTVAAVDSDSPLVVVKAFPTEDTTLRRTTRVAPQQEFTFLPFLVVRGRWLGVDPALLYHALRYYHAHPQARSELATDDGLRRIRSGNLLD